jgi:hypothetical protein
MSNQDMSVAAALELLEPPRAELREWERVIADAQVGAARPTAGRDGLPRRRRRLVAVVIAITAVLVPLAAVAATQGWWFLGHGAPTPVGGVAVVTRGEWNGIPWTMTAYRSSTDGVCTGLTPQQSGKTAGMGAGLACDTITGVPRTSRSKPFTPHGISYMQSSGSGRFPSYVVGPVVAAARSVEVTLSDKTVLQISTFAAPKNLQSQIRFYLTQLPRRDVFVRRLVARSGDGKIVATLDVPRPPFTLAENRISNRGTPLQLSPAMKHRLRLAHRRAQVWLLASRAELNFYRFGRCFGVGKAGDATTFPASRGPAAFGSLMCSRGFPSRKRPVLDASIYGATRRHPQMTLERLSGFASDSVVSVSLLDRRGRIVQRVPVVGNVYAERALKPGVVTVVMTDRSGRQLVRCGPGATTTGAGTRVMAAC